MEECRKLEKLHFEGKIIYQFDLDYWTLKSGKLLSTSSSVNILGLLQFSAKQDKLFRDDIMEDIEKFLQNHLVRILKAHEYDSLAKQCYGICQVGHYINILNARHIVIARFRVSGRIQHEVYRTTMEVANS